MHFRDIRDVTIKKKVYLDNIVCAILQVSVPFRQIRRQELLDENPAVLVEILGKEDFTSQDSLINAHRILVTERRLAHNHFVDKDTWKTKVS